MRAAWRRQGRENARPRRGRRLRPDQSRTNSNIPKHEASIMTRWLPDTSKRGSSSDDPSSDERIARLLRGSQEALRFAREFARIDALHRASLGRSHYNPNQPRVAAGNPDGGQWTSAGGSSTRVAARDKQGSGGGILLTIVTKFFLGLIDAYRSENGLWDLFGHRRGTVTVMTFRGNIFSDPTQVRLRILALIVLLQRACGAFSFRNIRK